MSPRHDPAAALRACAIALLAAMAPASAAVPAALYDGADGATCTYYNFGAQVAWRHPLGDWRDARGAEQGPQPYARATVRATDARRVVQWDVTPLVREWLATPGDNQGLVLRALGASDNVAATFNSREAPAPDARPRLVLVLDDGTRRTVTPAADATLDCSTYRSLGGLPTLTASAKRNAVMQFDLTAATLPRSGHVAKASLELTTTEKQYGDGEVGIFRLDAPVSDHLDEARPVPGLAAAYPRDAGIARDPAVLMATGFEATDWRRDWSYVSLRSSAARVSSAPALGFEPLDGHALQVTIPAGDNLGLDMGYKFAEKVGAEPDEIYFRYYLRLASDWQPSPDGGKLPGISGTYGSAGWGGRKSDGHDGWSMRGMFFHSPDPQSPYRALTPIGTYAYHADMEDLWGDAWPWSGGGRGLLERNRWYCVEQYFRVNHPGAKDGILRAWIDGRPVFERTNIRVRDVDTIRIEQIWMNVYYGGQAPARRDLHLFIDNVVVARKYIGPVAP